MDTEVSRPRLEELCHGLTGGMCAAFRQGLPGAFNWSDLGKDVAHSFSTLSFASHMLGPLDLAPKPKKQRQRQKRVRAELGSLVNPEELQANEDQVAQQTDKNMEVMNKTLRHRTREGKETSLAHLVYNPDSFAQTVENLFTFAFLIRDGRANITRRDGKCYVMACKTPEAADWADNVAVVSQFVLRFSMKEWRELGQALEEDPALAGGEAVGLIATRERVAVPERAMGKKQKVEG
eukprot:scaffold699_cov385-Prasinococcus_capsulatus_cf.AAC.3